MFEIFLIIDIWIVFILENYFIFNIFWYIYNIRIYTIGLEKLQIANFFVKFLMISQICNHINISNYYSNYIIILFYYYINNIYQFLKHKSIDIRKKMILILSLTYVFLSYIISKTIFSNYSFFIKKLLTKKFCKI